MIKVDIKNFQILRDASLEIEGITCIVGDTNEGKSALIRAIESAMFNAPGNEFITHGARTTRVVLSFDEEESLPSLELDWQKGQTAVYNINGKMFTRLGKKTPEDIALMGIKEFEVRGEQARIMFWRQLESPFLVHETPSYIFEFVSKILEEQKLLPISKQMASDMRSLKEVLIKSQALLEEGVRELEIKKARKLLLESIVIPAQPHSMVLGKGIASILALVEVARNLEERQSLIEQTQARLVLVKDLSQKVESMVEDIDKKAEEAVGIQNTCFAQDTAEEEIRVIKERLHFLDEVVAESSVVSEKDLATFQLLEELRERAEDLDSRIHTIDAGQQEFRIRHEEAQQEFEGFQKKVKVCPLCERPF